MKKIGILFFHLLFLVGSAQTQFSNSKSKDIQVETDSIQISDVSISPANFKVIQNGEIIPPSEYKIDFEYSTKSIGIK